MNPFKNDSNIIFLSSRKNMYFHEIVINSLALYTKEMVVISPNCYYEPLGFIDNFSQDNMHCAHVLGIDWCDVILYRAVDHRLLQKMGAEISS